MITVSGGIKMKYLNLTYERLLEILFEVWSEKSSTKFSPDNPALGQCGVTALVVNDLLGDGRF
jgi:hypothetical protein